MVVLQQSIKTLCFLLSLKDSFYKHEFGNPYLLLCEYFIFHIMNTKRLKYPSLSSAWSSGTSNPLPHLQSPEGHSIFYPHFQLTRFSEGGSKCYFPGDKWIDFPWSCNSSNGSNRIQWFSWGVSCIGTLIIIFFLGWGVGGGEGVDKKWNGLESMYRPSAPLWLFNVILLYMYLIDMDQIELFDIAYTCLTAPFPLLFLLRVQPILSDRNIHSSSWLMPPSR